MASHGLLPSCSEEGAQQHVASKVMRVLELSPERVLSIAQLSERLDAHDVPSRCLVQEALCLLQVNRRVEEVRPYVYALRDNRKVVGTLSVDADSGQATLLSLHHEQPIPVQNLRGAKSGDTVEGLLTLDGERIVGADVLRVLRMVQRHFTGIITLQRECAWFIPEENLYRDVKVPLFLLAGAKDGDSVVVEVDERTQGLSVMQGKVVRLLGSKREPKTYAAMRLERYGFSLKYSEEAKSEARRTAIVYKQRKCADIIDRRDMRGIPTFTIDPADAHEIDDALSVRKLRGGGWEIGVHIADVSHYVKPGLLVDEEAYRRGTSLYLPEKAIAMLPPEITEICSLEPHEDRLAFSVIFRFTESGRLLGRDIERTVIRSQRKFSYDEVASILQRNKGDYFDELYTVSRFAQQMRNARSANGALFFHGYPELKFEFDDRACPITATPRPYNDAMKLVEEFMLLANRTIAQAIGKYGKKSGDRPFLYRVHGFPKPSRFSEFVRVARNLGYTYTDSYSSNDRAKQLNSILDKSYGKPEENLLATLALGAMSRAYYYHKQRSHYGLAFEYYTHFTSPLRRYADIIVHRLIEHYLLKQGEPEQIDEDSLLAACRHINQQQQRADNVVTESVRHKSAQYMANKVGQTFEAVVFNFTERFMLVQMQDTGIYGRVFYADMMDDHYFLDKRLYTVTGTTTGKTYCLGDLLSVRLLKVDLFNHQICFAIGAKLGTTSLSMKKNVDSQLYLPFTEI
jgi:ribonuclease R